MAVKLSMNMSDIAYAIDWMQPVPLAALLHEHLARRPGMTPRDLYKLLYQGVLGPEHIIVSAEKFVQSLWDEWQALQPARKDPLWESIRPDGRLLRLNLRPYRNNGGSLERLAQACLQTARLPWGTPADLRAAWAAAQAASQAPAWAGPSHAEMVDFSAWLHAKDFPAVHHSDAYRRQYRPAYRLAALEIAQSIGLQGL